MNIPGNLLYTKNDEWILVDDRTGTIGITDYAQDQLSDVVYVEVSVSEGDSVAKGETFGAVESVKAASDVYMPVTGKILAVNEALEDAPELINSDPYGEAWMVKIEFSDPTELDTLMDSAKYEAYLADR